MLLAVLHEVSAAFTLWSVELSGTLDACYACEATFETGPEAVLRSAVLDFPDSWVYLSVDYLLFDGEFYSILRRMGQQTLLYIRKNGTLKASTLLTSVVKPSLDCPNYVLVQLYRDKVVLRTQTECVLERYADFIVSFAGSGDIHYFKTAVFTKESIFVEANNLALSGKPFLSIVNELKRATKVSILSGQRLIKEFEATVEESEDLSLYNDTKYWVLILTLAIVILVVVVFVVGIALCKRRNGRKINAQVSRIPIEQNDELYGQYAEAVDFKTSCSISRQFGSKEVLGSFISDRIAKRTAARDETAAPAKCQTRIEASSFVFSTESRSD